MSRTTKTTNRWPRMRGCPGPAAMRALLQGQRHFGDELRTRRHDRFDVRPAGRAGGLGGCGGLRCQPAESTVCGGLMNGGTCDAVGGGAGVAVHDGGVLGPTSRRRKPQLLRSPERSAPGYSERRVVPAGSGWRRSTAAELLRRRRFPTRWPPLWLGGGLLRLLAGSTQPRSHTVRRRRSTSNWDLSTVRWSGSRRSSRSLPPRNSAPRPATPAQG
jgi:hypothetical protein